MSQPATTNNVASLHWRSNIVEYDHRFAVNIVPLGRFDHASYLIKTVYKHPVYRITMEHMCRDYLL